MQLPISDILDSAWTLSKKHGITLAVFLFIASLFSQSVSLAFMPAGYWTAIVEGNSAAIQQYGGFNLGTLVQYLINFVAGIGIIVTALRLSRGSKENLSLNSFRLPINTYLNYLAYGIVYGIIVAIGLVFLIVPGIYLAARLAFGGIYILDNPNATFIDGLKASWRMTEGHALNLIGLGFLLMLIVLLGLLACCIGIFFTTIIAEFAAVLAYLFLLNPTPNFMSGADSTTSSPSSEGYDQRAY